MPKYRSKNLLSQQKNSIYYLHHRCGLKLPTNLNPTQKYHIDRTDLLLLSNRVHIAYDWVVSRLAKYPGKAPSFFYRAEESLERISQKIQFLLGNYGEKGLGIKDISYKEEMKSVHRLRKELGLKPLKDHEVYTPYKHQKAQRPDEYVELEDFCETLESR